MKLKHFIMVCLDSFVHLICVYIHDHNYMFDKSSL